MSRIELSAIGAVIVALAGGTGCGGGGGDEAPRGPAWEQVSIGEVEGANLSRVEYGNGVFVALHSDLLATQEYGSAYVTSSTSDGSAWTPTPMPIADLPNDLAFGAGRFVVVTEDGYVLGSDDGSAWTALESPIVYLNGETEQPVFLSSVAFANGTFMAVGNVTVAPAPLVYVTSADGSTWSEAKLLPAELGTGYMGLFVSTADDQFAVFRGSRVGLTPDGTTWTMRSFGDGSADLQGFASGNGVYVAATSSGGLVAVSSDLVHWTATAQLPVTASPGVDSVSFVGGLFIVTGGPTILTSADGRRWATAVFPDAVQMWGAAFGNDVYLVTGTRGITVRAPSVQP